eukprot:17609-Heterococcus_DN1.PRE.4
MTTYYNCLHSHCTQQGYRVTGTNAAYASNNRSSGSRGAYDGPPRLPPATIADPAAGHWAQVVATAKGTADTEPSSAPTSSTPTTATGVTSSQRLTLAEAEAALSAALTSSSGALSAERAHERFLSCATRACAMRTCGVSTTIIACVFVVDCFVACV